MENVYMKLLRLLPYHHLLGSCALTASVQADHRVNDLLVLAGHLRDDELHAGEAKDHGEEVEGDRSEEDPLLDVEGGGRLAEHRSATSITSTLVDIALVECRCGQVGGRRRVAEVLDVHLAGSGRVSLPVVIGVVGNVGRLVHHFGRCFRGSSTCQV